MIKILKFYFVVILYFIVAFAYGQMDSLKEVSVSLSFRGLKSIPDSIFKIDKLVSLDVSINKFTDVYSELIKISKIKTLRSLNLSYCYIDSLPDEICNLTELENLDLSRNSIKIIPQCFSKLANLKQLDLSVNKLRELSHYEIIFLLQNLENLDLYFNDIDSISYKVGNMKKIKYLHLGNNRIENLPIQLLECENLFSLLLNKNNITVFPEFFYDFKQLIIIELLENKIISGYDPVRRKKCKNLGLIMDKY